MAKTTVFEKERWLLDQPSRWLNFHDLVFQEQKELLGTLFREMKEHGFYAQWTTVVDGRASLRTIIERLIAQGKNGVSV